MRVQKIILLEIEVAQRLSEEENASALINQLLLSHYKDNRTEEEIIKDVQGIIKGKEDDIKHKAELEKKLAKRIKEMAKHKEKQENDGKNTN